MRRFVMALRGALLATTLFVVASTTIWWKWLDWEEARKHLLPTLLASPVIWWVGIGRKHPPRPLRGIVAGALGGLLTQLLPHLPMLLNILSQRGTGDGEDQAVATMSVVIYLTIGFTALLVGGILGLMVVVAQRYIDRSAAPAAALLGASTANGSHHRAA